MDASEFEVYTSCISIATVQRQHVAGKTLGVCGGGLPQIPGIVPLPGIGKVGGYSMPL
jgi:hypothetical protein